MLSALAVSSLLAQVKQAALAKRYPVSTDGAFLVGGGAELLRLFLSAEPSAKAPLRMHIEK